MSAEISIFQVRITVGKDKTNTLSHFVCACGPAGHIAATSTENSFSTYCMLQIRLSYADVRLLLNFVPMFCE